MGGLVGYECSGAISAITMDALQYAPGVGRPRPSREGRSHEDFPDPWPARSGRADRTRPQPRRPLSGPRAPRTEGRPPSLSHVFAVAQSPDDRGGAGGRTMLPATLGARAYDNSRSSSRVHSNG